MNFQFVGKIPASKSLMNRALICSSYSSEIQLQGHSSCDDVVKMKNAIDKLRQGKLNEEFDCGAAGTVLRFLALRLSRIPGRHVLVGTERLMQRPQKDLLDLFTRLGVQYQISGSKMILESQGWQNITEPIVVNRDVSSQFASGLILNAWGLSQDLVLKMKGNPISEGYLEMTLQVVEQLGMKLEKRVDGNDHELVIKANSQITKKKYEVESDLSSAFAVAAFAGLNGQAVFESFPNPSLQPDFEFVNIMKQMNFHVNLENEKLVVKAADVHDQKCMGVEANLASCPDLFPVLATLCAFAGTSSRLFGAPQLVHKESNRIAKISELLKQLNVAHECRDDGMVINPQYANLSDFVPFEYDTDHDHRLAFAAALVKSQGVPIRILNPQVVSKSFPEFWQVVGLDGDI